MEEKVYDVTLTESNIRNLADFIEVNLFDIIRKDEDIDNILWLNDMCEAYTKLREAQEKLKKKEG